MGMVMSFLGKGLPSTQVLSYVMGALYQQFVKKPINTFEDFHIAILDIFNTFNSALPGKHYDVPPLDKVEKFFKDWEAAQKKDQVAAQVDRERKNVFNKFIVESININKPDAITLITGIVTPPAAMAAKRAGENVPQLKMIKAVPDVIFVPSLTVLALVSVKLTRRMFLGNTAS